MCRGRACHDGWRYREPVTIQPSGAPSDDPQGSLLASDAEREATVDQLRIAAGEGRLTMEELSERSDAAYRSRTTAELASLTRDLPAVRPGAPRQPVAVTDTAEPNDSFIAVFSGSERKGHWRVPRRSTAVAVFGGVALDLRQAEFTSHDVYLEVIAVFGGVEINVPEGVEVHLSGWAAFGGKASKVSPALPGAPVLHIRCKIAFGGVEVNSKPLDTRGAVRYG